ncbi:hypothetical protein [Sphingobacterium multivorum]|uniref:Uncharacterized protein n=1 Tax=Sphingobacterium multivorum TaxID=28454 RepID=A0A2X2JLM4_SPHMU|nr:hypothetical protein [Sphingobacterium multivorum]QRQ61129.1 hypothetical protein I6J33_24025 [Sphingobacterium multivorum]SPZ88325.1 Uncharacterised protein [Sphingobacterium multivorum]
MNTFILFFTLFMLGHGYYAKAQNANDYLETNVTFPANYKIGDFIEFATSKPLSAGASAYYEVSITYARANMAAAATHIVSSSHANSPSWQEAGRVNNNVYTTGAVNFTIDHNPNTKAFRVRAIETFGVTAPLVVYIKIRSINFNTGFNTYLTTGNEPNLVKRLPMTYDWDLVVGNTSTSSEGSLAIKAALNGNFGIGTPNPTEKLAVNGTIRAKEIKVEANLWPDYVFNENHQLMPLDSLASFVKENKHLPNIAPAKSVEENGIALGELNRQLLQKIEEMTLYLIDQSREIKSLKNEVQALKTQKR